MNAFDPGVCGIGVVSLDQEALKTRPMITNNPSPSKTRRKLRRRESVKMAISSLMTIVGPKRHEGDALNVLLIRRYAACFETRLCSAALRMQRTAYFHVVIGDWLG